MIWCMWFDVIWYASTSLQRPRTRYPSCPLGHMKFKKLYEASWLPKHRPPVVMKQGWCTQLDGELEEVQTILGILKIRRDGECIIFNDIYIYISEDFICNHPPLTDHLQHPAAEKLLPNDHFSYVFHHLGCFDAASTGLRGITAFCQLGACLDGGANLNRDEGMHAPMIVVGSSSTANYDYWCDVKWGLELITARK